MFYFAVTCAGNGGYYPSKKLLQFFQNATINIFCLDVMTMKCLFILNAYIWNSVYKSSYYYSAC